MNKLKRLSAYILSLVIILTAFNTSAYAAETLVNKQSQAASQKEYLESVRELVRQKYNGQIPEEAFEKAATLKDIFETLDDYSVFMTPKEYDDFTGRLSGSVEGIGFHPVFEEKDKYVSVGIVIKNSPAWKAGVLSGDQISTVDGESVAGQPLDSVIGKIKGIPGTKVRLGLIRQGVKNILQFEITRARIDVPTVHYEIRGGNTGYIKLDSFSENTGSGVAEALKYFDAKKITKVALDLRNNGGGYAEQAAEVAQYFVPKGLITKLDFKDEATPDETYYSSLAKLKYKLAVLVNENSASASEILTGAIKDTKAGIVVGNKTFGKAKVQSFFPILDAQTFENVNQDNEIKKVNALDFFAYMPSDAGIAGWGKMTVGLYYTPNGDCIDLKGIEPNVKVTDTKLTETSIPVNMLEPLTVTVKPKAGAKYVDVYYTELILKLMKYNVGKPDMTLDSRTVAAIKKFQKDNGVYSYGELDFCTQKLLNNRLSAMKQIKDPVYAKAAQLLK